MYPYVYLETAVRQKMTESQEQAERHRLVASTRPRRRFDVIKAFARLGTRSQHPNAAASAITPGVTPGITPVA